MLDAVAAGVWVHRSPLLQNNTVVVRGRSGVLVIDPGITAQELVCLANDIRESGQAVGAGFATHPDWDHALWHPDLGDAPRYGTERCAADLRDLLAHADWRDQLAEVMPPEIADEVPLDGFGRITGLPAGTKRIPWDGPAVRILEHQAHAHGHAALLIEEPGVLVAGDMLSDIFMPFLDLGAADPAGDYLDALRLFDTVAEGVTSVIPGHGAAGGPGEVRARIELDRAYVEAVREGRDPGDPRVGPAATFGQEWLPGLHEWQAQQVAGVRGQDR